MEASAIVDPASLEELREILEETFIDVLKTYINDSQERIDRLEKALSEQDFDAIMHEAHGLKGSSKNLGAHAMVRVCEQLERQSKKREIYDSQQQFAGIQQNFAAVCRALEPYLT